MTWVTRKGSLDRKLFFYSFGTAVPLTILSVVVKRSRLVQCGTSSQLKNQPDGRHLVPSPTCLAVHFMEKVLAGGFSAGP